MSEDMFGTFLGTNQLTNQPKRFLRKISGRYVPRVFLLFLQNILQKTRWAESAKRTSKKIADEGEEITLQPANASCH